MHFWKCFYFWIILDLQKSRKDSMKSSVSYTLHLVSFILNILYYHSTFVKTKKLIHSSTLLLTKLQTLFGVHQFSSFFSRIQSQVPHCIWLPHPPGFWQFGSHSLIFMTLTVLGSTAQVSCRMAPISTCTFAFQSHQCDACLYINSFAYVHK